MQSTCATPVSICNFRNFRNVQGAFHERNEPWAVRLRAFTRWKTGRCSRWCDSDVLAWLLVSSSATPQALFSASDLS